MHLASTRSGVKYTAMRMFCRTGIALLALALVVPAPERASAQTLIRGTLLDERTEEPVSAGLITLLNERMRIVMSAETDADGRFVLQAGAPGRYVLRSQRLGYRNTSSPPMELIEGDTLHLEYRISPDAVYLAPVTVTASARRWWENSEPVVMWSFYERRDLYERMGMGRFMVREELEIYDAMSVTGMLQTMPGIRIDVAITDGAQTRYPTLRAQAGVLRPCQPDYYVDGQRVRFRSPADEDFGPGDTIDSILEVSQLVGMEIYDGTAILPGEFGGMTANCGVIAFWTSRQG